MSLELTLPDISLLNHCFSTKTLLDVQLGCNEEARQVLQASMTDPSIRHAVLSLRALREDLEISGDGDCSESVQQTRYHYGVQQYSMALGGLASNLSNPSSNALRSALLCCQVFISIEQLYKDYSAMAQHIIRGLGIMREYRARPFLITPDRLAAPYHGQLPLLDVFIIKLFAAPCRFAEPSAESNINHQAVEISNHHKIAPDMKMKLTSIAMSTLEFLEKVKRIESIEAAHQLLSKKRELLDSLESWAVECEMAQKGSELITTTFMHIFQLLLKIVLMGTLDSTPDIDMELNIVSERLKSMANDVSEKVKSYVTCSGRGRHFTIGDVKVA